jgi:hypothetical protein
MTPEVFVPVRFFFIHIPSEPCEFCLKLADFLAGCPVLPRGGTARLRDHPGTPRSLGRGPGSH